eukprot:14921491-Heterocapsa_arctica.AAC.1
MFCWRYLAYGRWRRRSRLSHCAALRPHHSLAKLYGPPTMHRRAPPLCKARANTRALEPQWQ